MSSHKDEHNGHKNGHHKEPEHTTVSKAGIGCFGFLCIAFLLMVAMSIILGYQSCTAPERVVQSKQMKPIDGTTPASLELDFDFDLVCDGPIRVTYADGQYYDCIPGQECKRTPTPRSLGPKMFRSLDTSRKNVNFRIYRLPFGEAGCR